MDAGAIMGRVIVLHKQDVAPHDCIEPPAPPLQGTVKPCTLSQGHVRQHSALYGNTSEPYQPSTEAHSSLRYGCTVRH